MGGPSWPWSRGQGGTAPGHCPAHLLWYHSLLELKTSLHRPAHLTSSHSMLGIFDIYSSISMLGHIVGSSSTWGIFDVQSFNIHSFDVQSSTISNSAFSHSIFSFKMFTIGIVQSEVFFLQVYLFASLHRSVLVNKFVSGYSVLACFTIRILVTNFALCSLIVCMSGLLVSNLSYE